MPVLLDPESLSPDAARFVARAGIVALLEKKGDDHFYGAWKGGSRAAGGHAAGSETSTEHTDADGNWTPERQKLHEAYVQSTLDGVPKTDTPTVYMTGGGTASGKTQALLKNPATGIPGKHEAAHIDPDSAKSHIPEYNAGIKAGNKDAANYVHEESSYMSKLAVSRALASGHSVVYDTVGDTGIAKLSAKVKQMREQGAKRVEANYATVSIQTAIARSDARALRTGRYVPHAYIEQAHKDVSRTARAAIDTGLFDSLNLWDTNGAKPLLVATYTKETGLKIRNQQAWDAFSAIGGDN